MAIKLPISSWGNATDDDFLPYVTIGSEIPLTAELSTVTL